MKQLDNRFSFGKNWARFLTLLDDERIASAEQSLVERLGDNLKGLRFLDAGSGSGLFSLAARNLGADVVSFDVDSESVSCAQELRSRFRPNDTHWTITCGDLLDREFVGSLGQFDVVYSWGVLHHTGSMWKALEAAIGLLAPKGRLFVSIYNDQGNASVVWTSVKRHYNSGGSAQRFLLLYGAMTYFNVRGVVGRLFHGPIQRGRGMDRKHDLIDWVGGWPFEIAKPEQVFDFCRARGLSLEYLKTCAGSFGCNEFVFSNPDIGNEKSRSLAPVDALPQPPAPTQ